MPLQACNPRRKEAANLVLTFACSQPFSAYAAIWLSQTPHHILYAGATARRFRRRMTPTHRILLLFLLLILPLNLTLVVLPIREHLQSLGLKPKSFCHPHHFVIPIILSSPSFCHPHHFVIPIILSSPSFCHPHHLVIPIIFLSFPAYAV